MIKNKIYVDEDEDEFKSPKYIDKPMYLEGPSFGSINNKFKFNTPNLYCKNRMPYQNYISNTVRQKHFYSPKKNNNKNEYYNHHTSYVSNNNNFNEPDSFYDYNYNNKSYSMRSMNHMNAETSPLFNNKYKYMNNSQDMEPIYLSDQKTNKNVIFSTPYKANRYSTEGTHKYNKNSYLNSQNNYKVSSIIYPGDENLNTSESKYEQLIIYPENLNKYENEKYFDAKTNEGILKPKNMVVYRVNWIENVYNDRRGRTKSCECLDSSSYSWYKDENENDYKIIKAMKKKRNVSSDQSNDIKTIKNKFNKIKDDIHGDKTKKSNVYEKKKISRLLDYYKKGRLYDDNIKSETNVKNGGIVYFNKKDIFKRQYNYNYIINKKNFNLVEYPKWKIVSSAILIQTWWRSLKSLYNDYLRKIIIIQKVYRRHYYKTRRVISRIEEEKQNKNYNEREFGYGIRRQRPPTYIYYSRYDDYERYPPTYECFYQRGNEFNENRNIKYIGKKSKYVYNKQNINYLKKEISHFNNSSNKLLNGFHDNYLYIGALLLKKILENKLIKIYKNIMIKIINNNKRKNSQNKKEDKDKDKDRYKYFSYITSNIFYSIIKRKKCNFLKQLHLYNNNHKIQSYDKKINKDERKNDEIIEYKYQKNEKKIINIKKENIIYEKSYDKDSGGIYQNNFDSNSFYITKNVAFSFINKKNNNIDPTIQKTNEKDISNINKVKTNINESKIENKQKLQKIEFTQNNLSMNNNFSISFLGDGINKQKSLCENNNSLNNNNMNNTNLEHIQIIHSFNKSDLSISKTESFSYIKNKNLLNIDSGEKNNNIKNEIDIVNESIKSIKEKIISMEKQSKNNKINEENKDNKDNKNNESKSNINIIEESINNNEINDKNKIQNDNKDINNNLKIISQPKSLQKIKDKKNKNDNTNDKDSNIKISSDNNRVNLINYGDYSKISNTKEIEKNKEKFIIVLNDKYKKLFYPFLPIKKNIISIQDLLLKEIFFKLWYKQAIKIKNAKRAHKKDKKILSESNTSINNDNHKGSIEIKTNNIRHLLLLNLMKFVMDKIRKEVKRRKLIICFKDINLLKYPNLRFALRKIKKFAKVRYRVMNEFASLIQNTFKFYLENKNKENQNEQINSNNQKIYEEKK